ncbi:MAG: hypothetical protein ACLT9P_10310 [Evtepia gabavorous]
MTRFPPAAVDAHILQSLGVPLKIERGQPCFPLSPTGPPTSSTPCFCPEQAACGACVGAGPRICALDAQGRVVCAVIQAGRGRTKQIPRRGGGRWPPAGRPIPPPAPRGTGTELARSRGPHHAYRPRPSLVPLEAEEGFCGEMQGLALKNVALRMKDRKGKVLFQEQGELLFTHFGLSGPLILSASAHLRDFAEIPSYRSGH